MKSSELISLFLSDADVQTKSKDMYEFVIKKYFVWVHFVGRDPDKLRRSDIIDYKKYLEGLSLSATTVRNYFSVVRLFYTWTNTAGHFENITSGIRSPKYKKKYRKEPLTINQVQQLLNSIDRSDEKGLRDYAIIMLLVNNGLRRGEVLSIDLEDITVKNNKDIIYFRGKGRTNKEDFIVITERTKQSIEDYLILRNSNTQGNPLFTSVAGRMKGKRLASISLSVIIKQRLKDIGINDKLHTCHSLRHTTATLLLPNVSDIHQVQIYLRHSRPSTTQLYTGMVDELTKLNNTSGMIIDNLLFPLDNAPD